MKISSIPLLLILACAGLSALNAAPASLTFKPAQPRIGESITVTYNPAAPGAVLKKAKEVTLQVLTMLDGGTPKLTEIAMKKKGKLWTATCTENTPAACLLLFMTAAGDLVDNNGDNCAHTMLWADKTTPVKGAYSAMATALYSGGFMDFKMKKDVDAAKKNIALDKTAYPGAPMPYTIEWRIMLRENPGEETNKSILTALDARVDAAKSDEKSLALLLPWYDRIGRKDRGSEITKEAIKADPAGLIARNMRVKAATAEKDPQMREKLIGQLLKDFPDLPADQKLTAQQSLIRAMVQNNKNAEAFDVFMAAGMRDGTVMNSIAWPWIEKGEHLEQAVEWAQMAADMMRAPNYESMPAYYTKKQKEEKGKTDLASALDTWAFGLMKLDRLDEAANAFREAYEASSGGDPEVNERYVQCLRKKGDEQKAMDVALECLRKGKSTDALQQELQKAYTAVHGSDAGYQDLLATVQGQAKNEMRTQLLKNMIDKPAPDFTLKALDGSTVTLSSLKGKVVVVDFWATWCGPCKMSFPSLQKMYDKYRNNPGIQFLTLDTWENEKGAKREDLVRKFIADNKYTFPVLFDEDYVSKFGVDGIPTKFFIGRNGRIRYKSVGFDNAQQMIDEMEMLFGILLAEK